MNNHDMLDPAPPKARRLQRLAAISGAGLIAGIIALGAAGVASASTAVQIDGPSDSSETIGTKTGWRTVALQEGDGDSELGDDGLDFEDISPEDDAVFERFDQCLQDAGIDFEAEVDDATVDAAFEQCEPILEDLSEGFEHFEGLDDISPEDEALFEAFDTCLEDAGVDFESESEADVELDDAAIDAAFEKCEPILEDLSDDFGDFDDFGELSPEDEAVFDQFDTCLENAGIDDLFDGDEIDDAAIDAVFESCDPILDGLSEEAQDLIGCPEDE